MATRTFAEKQSIARAKVKAREVARISKGYVTTHEKYVAKKTGVSALERAKYELETAKAGILKKPTIVSKVPTAKEKAVKDTGIKYDPSGRKYKILEGGVIQTYFEEDEPKTDFYGRPIGAPKTYGEVTEAKPFTPKERIKEFVEYGYAPEIRSVGAFIMGGIPSPPKIKEEPKLLELKEEVARRKEIGEPLHETIGRQPSMPTAEVYAGWETKGAGKAVFEERPISEIPIAVAPFDYELARPEPSRIYEVEAPTRSQIITSEIDKILSPMGEAGIGTRMLAGAIITTPYKIGKTIYEDPIGSAEAMVSPKAWYETGRYFWGGLREGDPTVVGELIGTYLTGRLVGKAVGKGTKFIREKLPKTTKTIAGAKEIARADGKSIFDIEAYTKVKEFLSKKRIVKTKGIFETKPKGDVVFTRGKFESVLLGKGKKPVVSEVVGFGKGKGAKALGIDLSKVGKEYGIQPAVSIKLFEKGAREFWGYVGETVGKKIKSKDIGFVGTKYIAGAEGFGAGVDGGVILKQISKVSKVVARPKITGDFIFPFVETTKKVKAPTTTKFESIITETRPKVTKTRVDSGLMQTEKQLEKSLQFQRTAQIQQQRQQQKQLQKLVQIPKVTQKEAQIQIGAGLFAQIQAPRLELKPLSALGLISPTITKARAKPRIPKVPEIIMPFDFRPKRETKTDRARRKRKKAIARKQQLAYAASVGAVTLGIRVPRVPTDILTGLELRPVVRTPKKKKGKRKRRSSNNYINNLDKILR